MTEEKLLYQFSMNQKAFRRVAVSTRLILTLLVMGGALSVIIVSVALGIIFALIVGFCGALWILLSVQKEQSYMVFADRVVIKDKSKRVSVPLDNIVSVSYKRDFYEKDLGTGTIYIRAEITGENGKKGVKKYKLLHVFDVRECLEYLKEAAKNNATENNAEESDVKDNDKE